MINDLIFKISEGSENAEPYAQDDVLFCPKFQQRCSKKQQILNMNKLHLESVRYFYLKIKKFK